MSVFYFLLGFVKIEIQTERCSGFFFFLLLGFVKIKTGPSKLFGLSFRQFSYYCLCYKKGVVVSFFSSL